MGKAQLFLSTTDLDCFDLESGRAWLENIHKPHDVKKCIYDLEVATNQHTR